MAVNLKKHGPYALITGASLGIGEEFAISSLRKGLALFSLREIGRSWIASPRV